LNPKVVVAIPTLNAGAPLAACLDALALQTFRDFETIIIDNGANAPNDARAIRIRPGENIGFGAAINLAARTSSAPYIACLNDDATPEPQWLGELVRAMDTAPGIGMCASCVLLDNSRLDSAGLLLCPDGSTKQRGHGQPPLNYQQSEEALMPSGSAALYRRELFDGVAPNGLSGFDESFFLYCEDSDLGLRAQWLGWQCRYVPTARVAHHYSLSAGRVSPLKAYLVERNRLAVAIKCLPLGMLLRAPFAAAARYWWHGRLPHGAASEFRREAHPLALVWIVLKAHLSAVIELPHLLSERRKLFAQARLSTLEFNALARRFHISPREVASQ
jgi:GT2 family glycosyltransferase